MWKKVLCVAGVASLALVVIAVGLFWFATGPRDLSRYPDPRESPYRLPFPGGKSYWCVQSNRGVVSHRGRGEFAYDFAMPVGSDICAARSGKVVRVIDRHDGNGYKWPNNVIIVEHADGTRGCYAHIKKGGSYVRVGDTVEQGQVIAASGHVGNSMMPHLHFHVTDAERNGTIPFTFADVTRHNGVPRMFRKYTSGNVSPARPAD